MTVVDRRQLLSLVACAFLAMGCGSSGNSTKGGEHELIVFAAASLRDVFTDMGEVFKRDHPGVTVTFNFAGTQELRIQLEQGASADVLASADQRHMTELVRASLAQTPTVFARNEPVIVVATTSDASIHGLQDLATATRIVIGAPEVPIGAYTLQILDRATATLGVDFRSRVEARVVSREFNVRQVLTKVRLGEAEAGIVYRTDAISTEPRVTVVSIASDINVVAEYPIAVVSRAAHPSLARAWVDHVVSERGQRLLASAGFLPPIPPARAP